MERYSKIMEKRLDIMTIEIYKFNAFPIKTPIRFFMEHNRKFKFI